MRITLPLRELRRVCEVAKVTRDRRPSSPALSNLLIIAYPGDSTASVFGSTWSATVSMDAHVLADDQGVAALPIDRLTQIASVANAEDVEISTTSRRAEVRAGASWTLPVGNDSHMPPPLVPSGEGTSGSVPVDALLADLSSVAYAVSDPGRWPQFGLAHYHGHRWVAGDPFRAHFAIAHSSMPVDDLKLPTAVVRGIPQVLAPHSGQDLVVTVTERATDLEVSGALYRVPHMHAATNDIAAMFTPSNPLPDWQGSVDAVALSEALRRVAVSGDLVRFTLTGGSMDLHSGDDMDSASESIPASLTVGASASSEVQLSSLQQAIARFDGETSLSGRGRMLTLDAAGQSAVLLCSA